MIWTTPIDKQIEIARQLLPDLVECYRDAGQCVCAATCPGHDLHSDKKHEPRGFQIWFREGEGPHEHCWHKSCQGARDELMRQLWSAIQRADTRRARAAEDAAQSRHYTPAPGERKITAPVYDERWAAELAESCRIDIDDTWLLRHSPVRIPAERHSWPRLMLDALYRPGDHILIFTKYMSQGQILHTVGERPLALEQQPPRPGYPAPRRTPTGYPGGGRSGVWYLTAPVTGEWTPNENNRDQYGARYGRRHAACCTRFPYLVLESDDAPPSIWLRILVQLADPIVAVYTSGGKSYHALVRVNADTKEQFDLARERYIVRLAAAGADPAAITAVRLSRLPGCLRFGSGDGPTYKPYLGADGKPAPRLQRLLYLNPGADGRPIIEA